MLTTDVILPFSEVLDWTLASVTCLSCDLVEVVSKLRLIPDAMSKDLQTQVLYLYSRYFISMTAITMATLDLLNERVFPISAKSYDVSPSPLTVMM